ncbi:MAG: hypothetical protein QOH99_1330 [Frankiaceae bacterium]|nr:hypothetical protein [Frankiaceae bacterium]
MTMSYDGSGPAAPLAYDDSGSGLPVVLLHAFPVHRGLWAGVREQVGPGFVREYVGPGDVREHVGPGVRLITPDLPGFGQSPPLTSGPSLDDYVDSVAGLLDAMGLERAVLGGVSMGGYVSLAFARRHPGRLLGLILADTKSTADAPAAATNRRRIAAVLVDEGSPRILVEESLPNLLGATTKAGRPDVVARVHAMVEAVSPAAAAWAQLAMAERTDTTAALRSLSVPVAVIVGAEDAITPAGDAEAMVAAARDATLTTIPRVGHLSAIEDPEAFAAAVVEFVSRL